MSVPDVFYHTKKSMCQMYPLHILKCVGWDTAIDAGAVADFFCHQRTDSRDRSVDCFCHIRRTWENLFLKDFFR